MMSNDLEITLLNKDEQEQACKQNLTFWAMYTLTKVYRPHRSWQSKVHGFNFDPLVQQIKKVEDVWNKYVILQAEKMTPIKRNVLPRLPLLLFQSLPVVLFGISAMEKKHDFQFYKKEIKRVDHSAAEASFIK